MKSSIRKVVVLKASTKGEHGHSSYALDCLVESLAHEASLRGIALDIRVHCLAPHFTHLIPAEHLNATRPSILSIVDDFFHNDLLLIGAQNHNFSPSLPLQAFFHELRSMLLEFDSRDCLIRRNLDDLRIAVVLTGRSSRLKYLLLNRFVFFVHFDLLFDFWRRGSSGNFLGLLLLPGHKIKKHYIENCLRSTFADRKVELAARMTSFAKKLSHFLD